MHACCCMLPTPLGVNFLASSNEPYYKHVFKMPGNTSNTTLTTTATKERELTVLRSQVRSMEERIRLLEGVSDRMDSLEQQMRDMSSNSMAESNYIIIVHTCIYTCTFFGYRIRIV